MSLFSPQTVVLVTASSNGLGAATARAFATSGARVVINYFSNAEKAESLVKELSELPAVDHGKSQVTPWDPEPPRCIAIRADVAVKSELISLVEQTVDIMGRLDVVVSNHGWTCMRDFYSLDENVDEEDWDRCYLMNVKSHLFLFHASKKYLDSSKGAFITTASLAGVLPSGSSVVR